MEILFDLVKVKFDLLTTLPSDFHHPRWIYGDALEQKWLTDCKLRDEIKISNEIRFGLIDFEDKTYFFSTGLEDPENLPAGLIDHPMNSGIFAAIVFETELPVKSNVTTLFLEEKILSQSLSEKQESPNEQYKGHDWEDLRVIFPNIFISEITDQFIGDTYNASQIASAYISYNPKYVSLSFKNETLTQFKDLCLVNSKILNYDNIIQSLLSSNFKFAFLDLYRCIELLYQITYVDDTYNKLALTIDRTHFLHTIDDKLNWRPIERQAIRKIFTETPETHLSSLKKTIKAINREITSHSDWIYDLRCSIVHLKSTQKKFSLSHDEWDKIILGIIPILSYWYQKYYDFR